MFEYGKQLKEYIQKEIKENKMHSNYGFNYYFCRAFLKRLYEEEEHFVLKGGFSQFTNTKKIKRPLTDVDIVTFGKMEQANKIIAQTTTKKNLPITFAINQKFETTNKTINYRILCFFDKIQSLIKLDLRQEPKSETKTIELPLLFSKDESFKVNTITLEEHLSSKLYICLLNLYAYQYSNKQFRRFKDFYDISTILKENDLNLDKAYELLQQKIATDNFLSSYQLNKICFDSDFIKNNEELWHQNKQKYEFQDNINFKEAVELTNDTLRARKK